MCDLGTLSREPHGSLSSRAGPSQQRDSWWPCPSILTCWPHEAPKFPLTNSSQMPSLSGSHANLRKFSRPSFPALRPSTLPHQPGASQRPNKKKKGNKSKQKNSPDPPINTHTKELACGNRKLAAASTPRGAGGSPHCSPSPGLVMTIPAPDRLQPPLHCGRHPSSFPTLGPLRKTP